MVRLDGAEGVETDGVLRLFEGCGGGLDARVATGGRIVHRGLAERAKEDPVRIDLVDVLQGDRLRVALAVTVLVRGALHAECGQSLSGGELLEDQAGAIALPTHDRVRLIEVAGILQTGAHPCDMLVELRELGLGLVGQTQRICGEREGLTSVTTGLSGEEDGRDLRKRSQGFRVVILHRGTVDEDEIRMGRTDSLEVRGTDRSKDRNVSGTIDQVVRDGR